MNKNKLGQKPIRCCLDMERAFESGTDNEGYGALAVEYYGSIAFGWGLPSINFCPWCGEPFEKEKANNECGECGTEPCECNGQFGVGA